MQPGRPVLMTFFPSPSDPSRCTADMTSCTTNPAYLPTRLIPDPIKGMPRHNALASWPSIYLLDMPCRGVGNHTSNRSTTAWTQSFGCCLGRFRHEVHTCPSTREGVGTLPATAAAGEQNLSWNVTSGDDGRLLTEVFARWSGEISAGWKFFHGPKVDIFGRFQDSKVLIY
jgi:hypothetical protein